MCEHEHLQLTARGNVWCMACDRMWKPEMAHALFRRIIDETWGEAMEDRSVPSTKLQNKILSKVGLV